MPMTLVGAGFYSGIIALAKQYGVQHIHCGAVWTVVELTALRPKRNYTIISYLPTGVVKGLTAGGEWLKELLLTSFGDGVRNDLTSEFI